MMGQAEELEPNEFEFAKRLTATFFLTVVSAALVLAWEIVLILFLGLLFGVFLVRTTAILDDRLPGSRGIALATVVSAILLVGVGGSALFFYQVNEQLEAASEKIDDGIAELRLLVDKYPAIESVASSVPVISDVLENDVLVNEHDEIKGDEAKDELSGSASGSFDEGGETADPQLAISDLKVPAAIRRAASTIGQFFRTTFGLLVNSLLIFFVGLFLAVSPRQYRDGAVQLLPPRHRHRATEVVNQIEHSLWRWLLGRFGSMLITGLGAATLLWLIGVPMAITLGMATGLLTFVPNIGAAVALLLAVLFALPQGANVVLMVVGAYLLLQLLESYVATPLIQQHQVSLPPALLISFQAVMGVLFGFLGAAVASPMLASAKTVVEMVYVNDFLERDTASS